MSSSPKASSTRSSSASAATGRVQRVGGVRLARSATRPRRWRSTPASRRSSIRGAARLYATGGNAAIYYGLGVTEHSQGSTTVMAIANLAMATGNIGRPGVGVNPLRGQNNVQGSCDMGSFPHELTGYRHISDAVTRADVREGVELHARSASRACASRTCSTPPSRARSRRIYIQGEDILQSDPNTHHVAAGLARHGMRRRAGSLPERDGATTPTSSCRAAPSSRRTARSRTPSAASSCVRQGDAAEERLRRLGDHAAASPRSSASTGTTSIRARSWTRSRG